MDTPTVPKVQARRRLAVLWFVIGGLATAMLLRAHGAPDEAEYWKWFSPYALPLAMLMIGALQADETAAEGNHTSRFYFRLCWGLLLFYGLYLLGSLVVGFNTSGESDPHAMLKSLQASSLPLTAVQGVLNLALGAFFVKSSAKPVAPAKEST